VPQIRPATEADRTALYRLAAAFGTSFRVESSAFTDSFERVRRDEHCFLAVADSGEGVDGYVLGGVHPTFFANGCVGWVEELMVLEGRRRAGVGRALMGAFEGWARSRGARLLALATRRATPFYLGLGYEESATYLRKLV